MRPIGALRAAIAFLTRVPVGPGPITKDDASWAPAFFPLVGGAVGTLVAATTAALLPLGALAAATISSALGCYTTGAFHEDGLADTADALGGTATRERALAIMKDSRIGSYGTVALVLVLSARITLIARIADNAFDALRGSRSMPLLSEATRLAQRGSTGSPAFLLATFIALAAPLAVASAFGRLAAVWLMVKVAHASPDGAKSRDMMGVPASRSWTATATAAALCIATFALAPQQALPMGLAVLLVTGVALAMARMSLRRLGGVTGDVLGATEQLAEVATLAAFAWRIG